MSGPARHAETAPGGGLPAGRGRRQAVFVRFPPWMRFQGGHPHDLLWPVGMLYAASIARGLGWETAVVDLHVEPLSPGELLRRVTSLDPRVVLVDTTTPTLPEARDLARLLHEALPGVSVWAVGQHASAEPESFGRPGGPFDGCLPGEYEAGVAELLARLDGAGAGAGQRAVKRAERLDCPARRGSGALEPLQVADPDDLPPLDPSPLLMDRYRMRSMHVPRLGRQRWGFLLSSRGCPYDCLFCSPTLRQSHGRTFRAQSARRVVDDLARLKRDHGCTAFYFLDDLFSYDRERVARICEEILRRRIRVSFCIQTRADRLDPELLGLLARAGCSGVKIGVESGSDRILALLRKGTTRERLLRDARAIRQAGLSLTACYMLGNPTETLAEIRDTSQLASEIGAEMIQVSFHTPYPGSESYRRFGHKVADETRLSHYDAQPVPVSEVAPDRLREEQLRFYRRHYASPRFAWGYLRRRALYRLTDPDEWRLILDAARFWRLPIIRWWPNGRGPGVSP